MNRSALHTSAGMDRSVYEPVFYDRKDPSGEASFQNLLEANPHIIVIDEIAGQLKELVKLRHPARKFSESQVQEAITHLLKGEEPEKYGVWVYYPWSYRLVHILGEAEFTEVRTNRNQYKITPAEKELLARQRIGVIGLSVGQSISTTMAMERSFGEIRLADFDLLELTNLNRIRTGIHNLGLSKVVNVAREIKEIDPFLQVKCFEEGLTPENIDRFFSEGGKLDLVVDECDGLDMKILCRLKAKELKVPVIMDASDRGCLYVERFDLEPDRPIFHGLIDHLDIDLEKISQLTNEEKIPYLLSIHPPETLSTRMKASMMEVEQTLTTWPQLASAVVLGGGMAADVSRRIILGHFHTSGRYFVDLEELIADEQRKTGSQADKSNEFRHAPELTLDDMTALFRKIQTPAQGIALSREALESLIEAANMAPSAGNNQPWKWLYADNSLVLFHDRIRSLSFGDYEDLASFLAFGSCVDNLVLKAHELDMEVITDLLPLEGDRRVIARFHLTADKNDPAIEKHDVDHLSPVIGLRHTNRKIVKRQAIAPEVMTTIKADAATVNGTDFQVVDQEQQLQLAEDIIAAAERIRIMHPEGHYEFFEQEIRWTTEESEATRDGIDIATADFNFSEIMGLKIASNPDVMGHLRAWKGGRGFEKISRKTVAGASAIGLVTVPSFDHRQFILAGRAAHRIWLSANQHKVALQPMMAPVLHFVRLHHGQGYGMDEDMRRETAALWDQFNELFTLQDPVVPVFLCRLFIGDVPEVRSLRRPVAEVLYYL